MNSKYESFGWEILEWFQDLLMGSSMELKPGVSPRATSQIPSLAEDVAEDFAEPTPRVPLVLFRDVERSLRIKTVETLTPLLPEPVAANLGEVSIMAETALNELSEIDLGSISDDELKPARVQVGLLLMGFSSLAMSFLLLYLYAMHPEMNAIAQIQHHWYQYIWFVCLGITGLFMLGREAMRPPQFPDHTPQESTDEVVRSVSHSSERK
jgi:hypothetical protein